MKRRHVSSVFVAAGLALGMALPGQAVADPGRDSVGNTGVSDRVVAVKPLDASGRAVLRQKDRDYASVLRSLKDGTFYKCRWDGDSCVGTSTGGTGAPRRFDIRGARRMVIKEQEKKYTCGPASLRNMVRIMNKQKVGKYRARSEATYERWLGTTREGTAIGSIVNVLNSRYSRFGKWKLADPRNKKAYLAHVVVNTHKYGQPLIQGLKTGEIEYFNNHDLNHFNYTYGYRVGKREKKAKLSIGEVWNPKRFGKSDYDPYGHKKATLKEIFHANDISGPIRNRPRLIV